MRGRKAARQGHADREGRGVSNSPFNGWVSEAKVREEATCHASIASKALLHALWREHAPILERPAKRGLQVVRP